ncbi:hypothetical protein KC336_g11329 [Hortaea werneckii]|nr:hypothetical protein KC336_g11329 [Hortaea werneckii]
MLVDDHLLYHPSWDRPDARAAELHQPAPVCLRPTVNKRHHWVCVLCSVSFGRPRAKLPAGATRLAQSGFWPGDSWADYGSVRLTGSRSGRPLCLLAPLRRRTQTQLDQSALEPFAIRAFGGYKGSSRKSVVVKPRSKGFNRKSGGDGKTFEYHICFDDLRDVGEAFKQVEMLGKDWAIKHVTQTEFASNVDSGNAKEKTSFRDGQAILAVNFDGNTAHFDPNKACDAAWPRWASPRKPRASRLDFAVQGVTTNKRFHFEGSLVTGEGRLHVCRGFDCKAYLCWSSVDHHCACYRFESLITNSHYPFQA